MLRYQQILMEQKQILAETGRACALSKCVQSSWKHNVAADEVIDVNDRLYNSDYITVRFAIYSKVVTFFSIFSLR